MSLCPELKYDLLENSDPTGTRVNLPSALRLNPQSRPFLEKLIVPQLVKSLAFYEK